MKFADSIYLGWENLVDDINFVLSLVGVGVVVVCFYQLLDCEPVSPRFHILKESLTICNIR